MRSYTQDLRVRIVAARQEGHSAEEIGKLFRVSKRSVERYWARYLETGAVVPKQHGGYRRSRLDQYDGLLRRWIKEDKGLTLARLQVRIAQDLGVQLGTTALWHRLERLGLSYKKNAARRRARPAGPPGRPPKMAHPPKKLGRAKTGLSR
jgi:transposase